MSQLLDSYRKHAEDAHAEAVASTLPQVRDRAARAAARWDEMVARQERIEAMQRDRNQAKALS